jgi:hypothetical protein
MKLGSRLSAAALRGRPIPFLGGWPEQLVMETTGRPLAFVFFCNDRMARAADGGDGEALAFFYFFSVMFAVCQFRRTVNF